MARVLPDYDELEIRFTPGREETYNVEIRSASGARGSGLFSPPPLLEIERFRRIVDPGARRVRGAIRSQEAMRRFGARLFDALVAAPGVRDVYTVARRDARAARRGLRITLSLRAAPELAGIPWEFLFDHPWFLAKRIETPIVRFVDLEDPLPPLRVEPPLRVLGMVSRPNDDALAVLDAEDEQAALEQRLKPLIDAGQVVVRWLERATLPALQQEADHGEDFHVFHYIGHGEYDEDSRHSSVILEHDDRRPHRVGGQRLGEVLCDRGTLRLAVLNTCEVAQTAPQDPLAGVATSLMEYDVPAVVAMQFAITDDGARTFADELYRALAAGYPVNAAVTQARRALAAQDEVEWGTPVLFMRVSDGRLFDLQITTEPATDETPQADPQETTTRAEPEAPSAPPRANTLDGPRTPTEVPPPLEPEPSGRPSPSSEPEPEPEPGPESSGRPSPSSAPGAVDWSAGAHQVREFKHPGFLHEVGCVAFSPDGRQIAVGTGLTARVWELGSGRELTRVTHDNWVRGVAFSPDGRQIATASTDKTARVWDAAGGRELIRVTHDKRVTGVAFSPDGRQIATASDDKTARRWELGSGRELARVTQDKRIDGVAFSPDGRQIATAGDDKTARVWEVDSGRELTRVTHDKGIRAIAFSADGSRIATASADKTARVWEANT